MDPSEFSYYMLEIHMENAKNLENMTFEAGIEIYHVENLR